MLHFILCTQQTRRRLQKNVTEPVVTRIVTVEKRLLAIPVLYIVLRMWGTLQFFYSLAVADQNINGCIPPTVRTIYLVFGILQVTYRSSFALKMIIKID